MYVHMTILYGIEIQKSDLLDVEEQVTQEICPDHDHGRHAKFCPECGKSLYEIKYVAKAKKGLKDPGDWFTSRLVSDKVEEVDDDLFNEWVEEYTRFSHGLILKTPPHGTGKVVGKEIVSAKQRDLCYGNQPVYPFELTQDKKDEIKESLRDIGFDPADASYYLVPYVSS